MISAILALSIALPTVALDGAEIRVWHADAGTWSAVYRCDVDPARMRIDRLAWAGPRLFIACPREPLASWQPGERRARPVANPVLARRRPGFLGGGHDAVFFAERGAVWRYRPGLDLLERIGTAPEWPLVWVGETPVGLLICGQFRWHWREGRWAMIKPDSFTSYTQGYPRL